MKCFGVLGLASVAALVAGCAAPSAQTRSGPLALVQTIPLNGVSGRIDHLAVDVQGQRLFVAALGNGTVEVVDLAAGKRIAGIKGLKEPQGLCYIAELNRLVVACGGDGTVRFYDGRTLQPVQTLGLGDNADNVRYDPGARRVWVGYGSGGLAALDPHSAAVVANVKLKGHPESFQLEKNGNRIFVNVPAALEVAVIDRDKGAVIAAWSVKTALANFPMGLDEAHGRLFIGCRMPARLFVYNTESGEKVAEVPCAGDVDDVFYDAAAQRLYVTGGMGKLGQGRLDVFEQGEADRYALLAELDTPLGARTSLFVADLGRLYVAVPRLLLQVAEIRVFKVGFP
jgi:hypothetical protein